VAFIKRGKRMEENRGREGEGVAGDRRDSGRMRVGEEEERTWKHARRTRADASIRGTGWHAGHACTYTRARIYVRHTNMRDTRECGPGTRARAIRGMRPGLNYVPRNAFSRESHCERSV